MRSLTTWIVFFALASLATAQVGTARLEGLVEDQTGAVIAGAKVSVVHKQTRTATESVTTETGSYVFPSLQAGIYTITVEAPGFRTSVIADVELNISVVTTQRIKLEVGQVTERVEVEATAVRVQTAESQLGRTVNIRDIDTLPVLGRSPINLAVFSAGVQLSSPGDTTFANINGQRQGANNGTLDGIDVNDAVVPRLGLSMTANNMDSVGEVHIVLNGAKAEYGRNAGGQVEMITRSGGNDFHGNLFDYHRNTVLNANNFFNNASGVTRPKYIQNLFGGSVSGPVIRRKTFFFFNYQGSRIAQDVTRNRTVLTPSAKRGVFTWPTPGSGALQTFDIAANDPRKIGVDKVMAGIFKLLPDPNNYDLGDSYNTAGFRFNNPAGSRNNAYTGKADHNLNDNHRLFFRYSWFRTYSIDSLNSADAPFPGMPQGWQGGTRWGFSTGSNWSLSPTLINELRVGHQSANVQFARPGRLQGPTIISNLFTDPNLANFEQGRNSPVDEVTDYVTKVHSNHTFKFGGNFRYTVQWGYNAAGIYPNVTTGVSLGATVPTTIGPNGASVISSAYRTTFENLYNDVLGRMNQVTQTYYSDLAKFQSAGTPRQRDFRVAEVGYFAQDDWKVTRNLVLNLGLRWEYSGIPHEVNGYAGTIDQAASMGTMYSSGSLTIKKGGAWYNKDFNNFAPRIGFAWDVFGDGKTAIRGSWGIFFDRLIGATISSVDGSTPGFSQDVLVYPNQATGADVRAGDGIPTTPAPAAPVLTLPATRSTSLAVFTPNLRTPYVTQYNFNIQREVLPNTVLEVGYVGSRGIKLFIAQNLNQQKIFGSGFYDAFREIQAFQANGTAVPASNALVKLFGSAASAITAMGATNVTQGQVGAAATNVDRLYYTRYAGAGLNDFYLRNYPQYISVWQGNNSGRSYYDSFQLTVRRTAGALKMTGNYTFAKSIDNSSVEGNGFASPFDSFNLALSRGRSDFDRAHSFNGSFAYTVPVGRGRQFGYSMPRWADSVVGGWELGSLVIWQSGPVFTISSGRNTTYGLVNSYINYTGDRNLGQVQRKGNGIWYFREGADIANFGFPGAGEFGNSGRNSFRGPRYFNTDISLLKRFRIIEGHTVTFRAEGYNAFNNANFSTPSASLTAPATFGRVSSIVGSPRIYQMALRYDF